MSSISDSVSKTAQTAAYDAERAKQEAFSVSNAATATANTYTDQAKSALNNAAATTQQYVDSAKVCTHLSDWFPTNPS